MALNKLYFPDIYFIIKYYYIFKYTLLKVLLKLYRDILKN